MVVGAVDIAWAMIPIGHSDRNAAPVPRQLVLDWSMELGTRTLSARERRMPVFSEFLG
jgi:hypothetical protein